MSENKLVDAAIIFLGFGLLFLALREFHTFIRPFVIALILTFLFVPLTRLSPKKKKLVWISSIGIAAAVFFITTIVTSFIIGDSSQVEPISEPSQIDSKIPFFEEVYTISVAGQEIKINDYFSPEKFANMLSDFIATLASSLRAFFSELFLVILFLIFMLPSHDATIRKISNRLNNQSKKKFKNTLFEIEKNIRSYLAIKTTISLITAILSAIIMLIFGVNSIFLFAFLIFVLNFIPSIGSIVAVAIVLFSHFISSGFSTSFLILAILLVLIQMIMGNYIEPQFAGRELELSPIVIILSLFFWGSVWGIGGMFFAVPLTSIIKIVLQNIDSTRKYVAFLS